MCYNKCYICPMKIHKTVRLQPETVAIIDDHAKKNKSKGTKKPNFSKAIDEIILKSGKGERA